MKQHLYITQRHIVRTAICAAILAILVCSSGALAQSVTQSGEQKNMPRGTHRPARAAAYQPNVIIYPDGR